MECFTDCFKETANRYSSIDNMGTIILNYLMENEEDLWKLLKYSTPDALSKPNLTLKEKRQLIWQGTNDSTPFRVFRSPFMDDAVTEQIAQLRIYLATIIPENIQVGLIDVAFEVVCHNKIVNLSNCQSRLEIMLQRIISTLNRQEVGGLGYFSFDSELSPYDLAKMNKYNNRNYFGYTLIMTSRAGDIYSEC